MYSLRRPASWFLEQLERASIDHITLQDFSVSVTCTRSVRSVFGYIMTSRNGGKLYLHVVAYYQSKNLMLSTKCASSPVVSRM